MTRTWDGDEERLFDKEHDAYVRKQNARLKRWSELMDARDHETLVQEFPNGFGGLEEGKQREAEHANTLIGAAVAEFMGSKAMTEKMVSRMLVYAGRIYGPRIMFGLDHYDCVEPEAYAELVPYVWGLAEYPGLSLNKTDWMRLWRKAGYTDDGRPAERPQGTLRLWRAAHPRYKRGFAWTSERKVAEWFLQSRYDPKGVHRLYEAVVPCERLLARIHEEGRGEHEYIVDMRAIPITVVGSKEEMHNG